MKRIVSVLLLVALCVTSASALIACGKKYTINYVVEGAVTDELMAQATPKTYKQSRNNVNLWYPEVDSSLYRFYGWYENDRYAGVQIGDIPAGSSGDVTYYGRVIVLSGYDITYILDGEEQTGKIPNNYKYSNNATTLWEPEARDGYYFSGWTESADDEEAETVAVIPRYSFGEKTYYGEFIQGESPATYSITFIFEGEVMTNTGMSTYMVSSRNRQITYVPSFNENDYGFAGWYLNEDYTGTAYMHIPANTEGDLVFHGRLSEPEGYAKLTGRKKAANFTAYFGDGTLEADKVGRDMHYGKKPLLLNFWSSKCDPCRAEMPAIQSVYTARGDEIEFLMLNAMALKDSVSDAQTYIDENGFSFPWIHDNGRGGNAAVTSIFKVSSFPTTIIIDKWGYIVETHVASLTAAQLNAMIDKALMY